MLVLLQSIMNKISLGWLQEEKECSLTTSSNWAESLVEEKFGTVSFIIRTGLLKNLTGCLEIAEISEQYWDIQNNYHYKSTYILGTLDRWRVKGLQNNCFQSIQTAGYSQTHMHDSVPIRLAVTYTHNTGSRSVCFDLLAINQTYTPSRAHGEAGSSRDIFHHKMEAIHAFQ